MSYLFGSAIPKKCRKGISLVRSYCCSSLPSVVIMSSLFYANPCKLDPDTIVTQLAWSNVDPIAAVACNTVDDRDRETHQIQFMNNEVRQHIF